MAAHSPGPTNFTQKEQTVSPFTDPGGVGHGACVDISRNWILRAGRAGLPELTQKWHRAGYTIKYLFDITLSEVSQTEKDKCVIWYRLYVESNFKKWYKWTYLQNRKTYRYPKQTYAHQRGNMVAGGGGINQELGMNTHTLLYAREITSKDLLDSKGNSTQYSGTTYMRKQSEK